MALISAAEAAATAVRPAASKRGQAGVRQPAAKETKEHLVIMRVMMRVQAQVGATWQLATS